MSANQIIESGILESYALGICSDTERAEVEQWLASSNEVRAELEKIEIGIENWAMAHASAAPVNVKSKILSQIENSPTNEIETPVVSIQRKNKINWLAAASITLLIGSVATNVILFNNYSTIKSELANIVQQNSILAEDLNVTRTNYSSAKNELSFISDANVQVLQMLSASGNADHKATIFWNRSNKEVLLAVNTLPNLPEDKQYQLWAIVDGQPVDAGVFDLPQDKGSMQKMHSFENAQAFAVTIENIGGSKVPSLETLTVIANV